MKSLCFEKLEQRELLTVSLVGDEVLVNVLTAGGQRLTAEASAVATSTAGDSVAVFEGKGRVDDQGVFFRRFDVEGAPLSDAIRVNTTIREGQFSPSVDIADDGTFVVTWHGRGLGDQRGVFAQWYDADGVAVGTETLVNSTTGGVQQNAVIAAGQDNVVVVWEGTGVGDLDGIFMRRFDSTGRAISAEMLVNSATAKQQAFPDVAMGSDGSFIVTWSSRHQDGSDWGVYAQRFDAEGDRLGGEFQVNSTVEASQVQASVATDEGGEFTIAWSSLGQDGDSWGVFAQKYAGNGNPIRSEIQLNATTEAHQKDVDITIASGGRIEATWTRGVPDGSGWEVVVRTFDAAGEPDSDEVLVNANISGPNSGHQQAPSIASSSDQIAIAWSGRGTSDRHGVFLQGLRDDQVNLPPQLEPIPDQEATVGEELEVPVSATDPNPDDILTFFLDTDDSPASAILQQIDNQNAVIRWTPAAADLLGPVPFRVIVVDDGTPPLADSESFLVFLSPVGQVDEAFAGDELMLGRAEALSELSALDGFFGALGRN